MRLRDVDSPVILFGLCALLAGCARNREAQQDATERPRCKQYEFQVDNGSADPVSVWATEGKPNASRVGTWVGEVAAGTTRTLTLPEGKPNARVEGPGGKAMPYPQVRVWTSCAVK